MHVFWRSVKNLKFSVFIPDLYLMVIEILLAFLFLKFTGISELLTHPDFIAASIEEKLPLLSLFLSENILTLLFYFVLLVFTSFVLGASLNAMRYGMIRDIVMDKRYYFRKVLRYGVRFWPIVLVRIIAFFLSVLALLFLSGSYMILKFYLPPSLSLLLVTFLGIASVFFLKLMFMFTYAIMFLENRGAFYSVKSSFVYFFNNKAYVLKVFFIIVLLSSLILPFEYLFLHYQNLFGLLSFSTLSFLIIRNTASAFYTVWSEVFVFYSCKAKDLPP